MPKLTCVATSNERSTAFLPSTAELVLLAVGFPCVDRLVFVGPAAHHPSAIAWLAAYSFLLGSDARSPWQI